MTITIKLTDEKIHQIMHFLGTETPEYNEIKLTRDEIKTLYELSQKGSNKVNNITIKTNSKSGIGTTVKVIIDDKETDITDVGSW